MSDDPTSSRDQLLHLAADDIRATAAKDLAEGHDPAERVVLALDTRDPLGAEWGAMLPHEPSEPGSVEARGAVGRLTEAQADAGLVPMLFVAVERADVVTKLEELDGGAAAALASIDRAAVVCVSAGGITVRRLAA